MKIGDRIVVSDEPMFEGCPSMDSAYAGKKGRIVDIGARSRRGRLPRSIAVRMDSGECCTIWRENLKVIRG